MRWAAAPVPVALLYFGSQKLGKTGLTGVLPAFRQPPNAIHVIPCCAVFSAPSRRGRDFEEEKSLDQRRRRSGGCRRAGRLWHNQLFRRPHVAAQQAVNRVMIAIQNPSAFTKGAPQIVDAYYDIRNGYKAAPSFSASPATAAPFPSASRTCPRSSSAPSMAPATAARLVNYQTGKAIRHRQRT